MKSILNLVKLHTELDLLHPETNEPVGVKLRVQNANIPALKKKVFDAQAYVHHAGKTNDPKEFSKLFENAEKAATELAGLALIGWDNDEAMGGPYTPEYARELMNKPELDWIRKQVNICAGAEASFLKQ